MIKKSFVALVLASAALSAHAAVVLNEGFNNVPGLAAAGWTLTNASTPTGITGWFQGDQTIFGSHAGAPQSYIAANFNNAGKGGMIDNYLITPLLTFSGITTLSFFERGADDAGFSDHFSVGFNTGSSTDFHTFSFGPLNTASTSGWTNFSTSVALAIPFQGHFAIRYTGLADVSNYIGIDSLTVTNSSPVPEPSTIMMFGTGLLGLLALRRHKQN